MDGIGRERRDRSGKVGIFYSCHYFFGRALISYQGGSDILLTLLDQHGLCYQVDYYVLRLIISIIEGPTHIGLNGEC